MIRLLRKRRVVVAGALLLCVLTASAYGAHRALDRSHHRAYALYQFAHNPPWFKAALKRVNVSGGTIPLPAGRVAPLQLFDLSPSAPIRLVGKPSTVLSGISIKRSNHIVVSGVRIAPAGAPAIADVSASTDVTFRNVRFLGTEEDTGVALQLDPDDRDITVAHAEFAHCEHGLACILAQGRGLTIDHVRFHDVRDADVIRGAADDVTISDSDLHDALSGTHGDNHNDLIQILGGGPWTIVRSHFGQRNNGAAQVYVDPRSGPAGPVHDVHVGPHCPRDHLEVQGKVPHVLLVQPARDQCERLRLRPAGGEGLSHLSGRQIRDQRPDGGRGCCSRPAVARRPGPSRTRRPGRWRRCSPRRSCC